MKTDEQEIAEAELKLKWFRSGKTLKFQYQSPTTGEWRDQPNPNFYTPYLWREKPEPTQLEKNLAVKAEMEAMQAKGVWVWLEWTDDRNVSPQPHVCNSKQDFSWVGWDYTNTSFRVRPATPREHWEMMKKTDKPGVRVDMKGGKWTWRREGGKARTEEAPAFIRSCTYEIIPLPEPTYRPWTMEEVPRGEWVKHKFNEEERMITGVGRLALQFGGYWVSFDTVFENWTRLDGSPCGNVEEAK